MRSSMRLSAATAVLRSALPRVVAPQPHPAQHDILAAVRVDDVETRKQRFGAGRTHIDEDEPAIFRHRVGGLPHVHALAELRIEEADTTFAIGWKGRYRIEGPAFVYSDEDTGRVATILGNRQAHPGGLIGKFQICLARIRSRAAAIQPPGCVPERVWGPGLLRFYKLTISPIYDKVMPVYRQRI
jgi:hypothetical protein